MAKGDGIARVDVADPDSYRAYVEANGAILAQYRARFIVRGGPFQTPEGTSRERNVVLEFSAYEEAVACWHSPEYQRVLALRTRVSTVDLTIIGRYEGTQPGGG